MLRPEIWWFDFDFPFFVYYLSYNYIIAVNLFYLHLPAFCEAFMLQSITIEELTQ